jgi:hypothetical protein
MWCRVPAMLWSMRLVFVLSAIGGLSFACAVSACGLDPSLTCGTACTDAATDQTVGMDAAGDTNSSDVVNDTGGQDAGSDVTVGGLDAACHAPDSSTPEWACPQSGCCPMFGGQTDWGCNAQGDCCRNNGGFCQGASDCCNTCAQGSGGNGTCVSQCAGSGANCASSSDCCINFWCGSGNT